jgi:hypothetical protein
VCALLAPTNSLRTPSRPCRVVAAPSDGAAPAPQTLFNEECFNKKVPGFGAESHQ